MSTRIRNSMLFHSGFPKDIPKPDGSGVYWTLSDACSRPNMFIGSTHCYNTHFSFRLKFDINSKGRSEKMGPQAELEIMSGCPAKDIVRAYWYHEDQKWIIWSPQEVKMSCASEFAGRFTNYALKEVDLKISRRTLNNMWFHMENLRAQGYFNDRMAKGFDTFRRLTNQLHTLLNILS